MSRVQIEILLGTLFILATSIIIVLWGVNEETRMEEFEAAQHGRAIEAGAALFAGQCSRCHGTQGLGIEGLCPPLNDRNFFDNRMRDVGWNGTLEDYIVATVSSGRVASTRPDKYPGDGAPAMPAFHENLGGPLREDQVRNLAAYILNWEATAQEITPPKLDGPAVGTDIAKTLPAGVAENGAALALSLGCTGCHVAGNTGPAWAATADQPGIGARAETRFSQADYTGSAATPAQYLFESIVNPAAYLVPEYTTPMPGTYSNQMTDQGMADLIAYLQTFR